MFVFERLFPRVEPYLRRVFFGAGPVFLKTASLFAIVLATALYIIAVTKIDIAVFVTNQIKLDALMIIILALALAWFCYQFCKAAMIQAIHTDFLAGRSAWSWYRFSFYIALFFAILIAFAIPGEEFDKYYLALCICTVIFILYSSLAIVGRLQRESRIMRTFKFAHGTVGQARKKNIDQDMGMLDMLGFSKSAANVARSLEENATNPITVFAIVGGMGTGKSTFWRVIAGEFSKRGNNYLHTYMSLTETNSEYDFSKLFAERWSETLKNRYPILFNFDLNEHQKLYSILRENSNGLLKDLIGMVTLLNLGFKTKTQTVEASSEYFLKNAPYQISRMFFHVPYIFEKEWFIVIDEIERAPFDELYRVIEVIERFKQQAKYGFPVKIIFVLNFDQTKLEAFLKDQKSQTEKTNLILDFFITGGSKTIDQKVMIPTQSTDTKIEFIWGKLKAILPPRVFQGTRMMDEIYDSSSDTFISIKPVYIGRYSSTLDSFERYSYIIKILAEEAPRVAIKSIGQTNFQLRAFIDDSESWVYNHKLTEFLIYSYLITKLDGKLLDIAKAVFSHLGPTEETRRFHDGGGMGTAFEDMDDEKNKPSEEEKLSRLINRLYVNYGLDYRQIGGEALIKELEPLSILIPKVYTLLINAKDPALNDETQYEGTLSERALFMSLVNFRNELKSDSTSIFLSYFNKIRKGEWPLSDNTAQTVVDFSAFFRNRIDYKKRNDSDSFFIAENILNFIESKNREDLLEYGNTDFDSNSLDSLTYEFVFQLAYALRSNNDVNLDKCLQLLEKFLKSKKVTYEAKLIVLDAFVSSGGSDGERRQLVTEKVLPKKGIDYFTRLFKEVQNEFYSKYISGGPLTLYNTEANPFYILHQMWDGSYSQDSNLKKLRQIMRKGLATGKNGLLTLWSVYPYEDGWMTYRDFREMNSHISLYNPAERGRNMKLSELINLSDNNRYFQKELTQNGMLKAKVEFWRKVTQEELEEFNKDEDRERPAESYTVAMKVAILESYAREVNSSRPELMSGGI